MKSVIRASAWQATMLTISVMALVLLYAQHITPPDSRTGKTLQHIDTIICAIFFLDFCIQLYRSRPRRAYLKWGWLDLISSIPMIPALRIARLARIARIIRVLRAARSSRHVLRYTMLQRTRSALGTVLISSVVLLLFSAFAIVSVEPTLPIREAFWWCIFVLITGEYGEFYPGSTEGRIIAVLLMTAGVAIFGTFTASVASVFLEEDQREDEKRDEILLAEIHRLRSDIREMQSSMTKGEPHGEHPEEGL